MLKTSGTLFLLALVLARTCAAAPDQWVQVTSSHFTVVTNDGDKQAHHLLDQFERMRWVFHAMFPAMNTDPANPIRVFAAKNSKTFETIEPPAYLAKGQLKLAGYFLRTEDKNYVLLRLDAQDEHHPFATVYHEYTHLQLGPALEFIPVWLNEGLAEFYQNTEFRNKDVHLGQADLDQILFLRQNRLIPLPVLFKVDASSPYYHQEDKGSIFYAESWALTHMLEINDYANKTTRVHDYLLLVKNHEDPVVAAEKSFGDLKKLQSALDNYISASSYREFVLNSVAAPIDETSYTSRVLSATEADALRADVQASVGRTDEAHALIETVLKADPNNVQARETLGMLALRDHNLADALKWYSEAARLDSKSYLAHYDFAQIAMMQGDGDPEAIEASLKQAIQLNPSFAPAYNQLAMFYGMHHEHLEEADHLIAQAIKLDPTQLVYRINGAEILLEARNYDGAQKVLDACLKIAKNPSEVATVQNRINQVREIQNAIAERTPVVSVESDDANPSARVVEVAKEEPPKHPTEPPSGPKHSIEGTMRGVTCTDPATLEFRVEGAKSTVSLYTNDYFKIDLTALGYTPTGSVTPCTDFEGRRARVQYAAVSDKTVDGQIIAIELHK